MMMTASQTMMPRPRSSDTLRQRLPALSHAGSFIRSSGSKCFAWLLLAVCIVVVSGGTTAMPAATVEGHETPEVDLGDLLDAGDGAVVTLVAGETRLVAHRAVLAARSPVFAAMFSQDPLEASSRKFVIRDVEGPELRKLVAFLYSGRAPRLPDMTPQLLEAATKYGVSDLRDAFEQQLARQLTVDSVAATAVLAVAHNMSTLRQAAVNFIREHGFQVMATQGWVDALHKYPGAVVEFTRQLLEQPTENCDPATIGTEATPTTRPISDEVQTPAVATPSSARPQTPTLDEADVTDSRTPANAGSEATPTTRPHTDDDRTPTATTATPFLTCPGTGPLDDTAVSRLRNLSGEERGQRLLLAAEEGAVEEVRTLLAAGADVGARDRMEWTALLRAAYGGHVEAVRCLLETGAAVGARSSGQWTPLHAAAAEGHTAVVQMLLAASADVNARSNRGWTPLHWAAYRGQEGAVAALLAAGADRGATDSEGKTPLHIAREENYQQLVQMLEAS